jgi:putative tricarboxylic transport membrane protein
MDLLSLDLYLSGLHFFSNPVIYFGIFAGVFIGIIFGALPGLTSTMTIAVFVPFTFGMDIIISFSFLIGLYMGAVYGGSISAIMVNIPGTPSSIATTLDGYEMCKKGEAGKAIGMATISSGIGGIISILILALFAPIVASFALNFSAQEFVGIALLGLSIIALISPGNMVKGLIAGVLGLMIGIVGIDNITAYPRFIFGQTELTTGVNIIPVMIGVYGLTEMFIQIIEIDTRERVVQKIKNIIPNFKEILTLWPTYLRCSIIGVFVGAIPAAGGSIASLVAYGQEKRFSSSGNKMGTGCLQGVAAPETANNASTGGALIPMLTLGIPGDPMTAVLMGALIINGLRPGPMLFRDQMPFVSTIFISASLAIFLMVIIGLVGARYFAKLISLQKEYLIPIILLLCLIGSYGMRDSLFDVFIVIIAGILGFFLRRCGFSPAPLVLGLILGPIFERNLRRAMILSRGDWTTFITRPISLILLMITMIVLFGPSIVKLIKVNFTGNKQKK